MEIGGTENDRCDKYSPADGNDGENGSYNDDSCNMESSKYGSNGDNANIDKSNENGADRIADKDRGDDKDEGEEEIADDWNDKGKDIDDGRNKDDSNRSHTRKGSKVNKRIAPSKNIVDTTIDTGNETIKQHTKNTTRKRKSQKCMDMITPSMSKVLERRMNNRKMIMWSSYQTWIREGKRKNINRKNFRNEINIRVTLATQNEIIVISDNDDIVVI